MRRSSTERPFVRRSYPGRGSARRAVFTGTLSLALAALLAPSLRGQEILLPDDAFWKFFRGVEEPPFDWNTKDFNDSTWEEGQAGFGYADNDDNTILDDMQMAGGNPGYLSIFIRTVVTIPNPDEIPFLQLGMVYDDGFVAYVNGVEIGRRGLTGNPPPFDATAANHDPNATPEWLAFPDEAKDALVAGRNVIAIQCHNAALNSSDLSCIPQVRYFTSVCPTEARCTVTSRGFVRVSWTPPFSPPPYTQVEILRDGVVIGMATSGTSRTFSDEAPLPGTHHYTVKAYVGETACTDAGIPGCDATIEGGDPTFRRGDADASGVVNLTDAVYVLRRLYLSGPEPTCPDSADFDDTGIINLTDAVYLLRHLYLSGPELPAPGLTDCGVDPSADELTDCVAAPSCSG